MRRFRLDLIVEGAENTRNPPLLHLIGGSAMGIAPLVT